MTCSATGNICDFGGSPFDTIVITEIIKGAVGGVVTEVLTYPGNVFPPATPDVLQTVTVLPSTVGAVVSCVPTTVVNNSGAAGAANCTATFSDNDIFPTTVASGNVSITLTGASGAVFASSGTTRATPLRCTTTPPGLQHGAVQHSVEPAGARDRCCARRCVPSGDQRGCDRSNRRTADLHA